MKLNLKFRLAKYIHTELEIKKWKKLPLVIRRWAYHTWIKVDV